MLDLGFMPLIALACVYNCTAWTCQGFPSTSDASSKALPGTRLRSLLERQMPVPKCALVAYACM
jgi:hypothetical protein